MSVCGTPHRARQNQTLDEAICPQPTFLLRQMNHARNAATSNRLSATAVPLVPCRFGTLRKTCATNARKKNWIVCIRFVRAHCPAQKVSSLQLNVPFLYQIRSSSTERCYAMDKYISSVPFMMKIIPPGVPFLVFANTEHRCCRCAQIQSYLGYASRGDEEGRFIPGIPLRICAPCASEEYRKLQDIHDPRSRLDE